MTSKRTQQYEVIRFMYKAAHRLELSVIPKCTAVTLYHKVCERVSTDELEPYLIATSCLYLAGKIEEQHVRLRDAINVSYRLLHPKRPELDIGSEYWDYRDSVVKCELYLMRVLGFQINFVHPHKFLLHYLMSLRSWLLPGTMERVPLKETAWAILNDSYHSKEVVLDHLPEHVAVAVLHMALQIHDVTVPYMNYENNYWWQAFVEEIKLDDIKVIGRKILDMYDFESEVFAT